jgi:hypothetical protein
LCLGFLDGVPGLIYCGLQGIQFFQIKAKVYEAKICSAGSFTCPVARTHDREGV